MSKSSLNKDVMYPMYPMSIQPKVGSVVLCKYKNGTYAQRYFLYHRRYISGSTDFEEVCQVLTPDGKAFDPGEEEKISDWCLLPIEIQQEFGLINSVA